ncbi:MAG: LPS export ABC transporter periplasmic protein LptC [Parvibaculum sp.]
MTNSYDPGLEPLDDERSPYSRFVTSMKFGLPLLAIILLLTLFISSGTFNSGPEIAITFQEVGELNDDLRMVSPRITGVDRKGRPYVVTAETATQTVDNPNRIQLETINADLLLDTTGDWLSITSRYGTLETEEEMLSLRGQIDVYAAQGYEFHAETAEMDLKNGGLVSHDPVQGQGPVGTITANGVEATENGEKITFTGGVRVVVYYK